MPLLSVGANVGGKYVVVKQLGAGGMSVVWLAKTSGGELVAIKEPRLDVDPLSAELNVAKLRHEANVLRQIRHDNIANFKDAYEVTAVYHGGTQMSLSRKPVILVVEYVDGRPLQGGRPVKEAKEVLRQLLEAVAAIHKVNIIHRDIKPSNVLLAGGKKVKLIDFGTSKYYYDSAREYVISPGGFTAPEQVAGLSLPQSDVWSVGATALYMVTGRLPCEYMQGYPCAGVQPGQPLAPTVYLPNVGDDRFMQFLVRSLHPNYAMRFPTAQHALEFLTKGYFKIEQEGLRLAIKNRVVALHDRVVVGRSEDPALDCVVEGGRLYIFDPQKYISRNHAEIANEGGRWKIRDLGSLNGTAIYRDGMWTIIHSGYGNPSPWVELRPNDVVAFAYNQQRGPYITASVVGI